MPAYSVVVPLPPVTPDGGIEKLDQTDVAVLDSLYRLACVREPTSQVFSTANPKLVMYHFMYRLRSHAWRIPALDAVVLMKRDGDKTIVYDVLARKLPVWASVALLLLLEIVPLFVIRDNLTLNVLALIAPSHAIQAWQAG